MDPNKTRAKLQQIRKEVEDRLAGLDQELHLRDEPLSADSQERAVELEGRELFEALDGESADALRQIDRALARLDTGVYGRCEACGKTIGTARLAALPFATLCMPCASSAEQATSR